MGKAKFYTDRHILCREIPQEGKAPVIDMFVDRRAGMTFPTANNPGYFCVVGLKSVITHKDKRPLELLAESEHADQRTLFVALAKAMPLLGCEIVYADCSKAFESAEMEFEQLLQKMGVNTISLFDASEFDGFESQYANFNAAFAPLDDYGRKGLLRLPGAIKRVGDPTSGRYPGSCMIVRDWESMTAETPNPWELYPAANAFNHVIMSYVISPYQSKSGGHSKQFSEGYGG